MEYSSYSLIFDPSEDTAIHWAARTGLEHALDLRTAEQLYTRALPYLKNWAWALATKHGWTQEAVDNVGDMPLAVCLGRDELVQGVDGDLSYVARLVLPSNFSDFLNPEFTHDWAVMFSHLTTSHSTKSTDYSADIFQLGRAGIPRPLQNILYLLQILSPGLLLVRSVTSSDEDDDGQWGSQGIDLVALPPSIWVGLHIEDLEDIFGAQTALKLYQAAEDPYCASEDASSAGTSYESLDATSDYYYYSDSSAGLTSDEFSDPEDWAAAGFDDLPEFEQDEGFVQYDPSQQVDHFIEAPTLSDFDHQYVKEDHGDYFGHHHIDQKQQEPPLISDNVGKASNLMEGYRHCDADCSYCGLCSRRFAESLTQRLLMHGALLAI